MKLGLGAAATVAPVVGGVLGGPVGGAIGGFLGGAVQGWALEGIDDLGAEGILLHAAVGAVGGGIGGWFGRNELLTKKLFAEYYELPLSKFDAMAIPVVNTAIGYTLAEGVTMVGRLLLSAGRPDDGALPTVSIGRGD
ncbi:hypothetical protein [Nocardia sp. NPDC051750]|uniref:hypothetical protein n=1 Tax=Nocardia sp. NPDC051750 TaxID=3364325 RepID=UPI0037AB86C7